MMMPNHAAGRDRIGRSLVVIAIAALVSMIPATAQVFEWSRMGGGPGWKHGNGIAVDGQGNSFVVGEFSGADDVPPSTNFALAFEGVPDVELNADGITDAFVVMYDATGTRRWVQQIGGMDGSATATSIALAVVNGKTVLYITGEISGTIHFNGVIAPGVPSGSSYLAKYTINDLASTIAPTTDWVATITPGSQPTQPPYHSITSTSVAVDANGDPFLCGTVRGTTVISFNGVNAGIATTRGNVGTSLFVARYWVIEGATGNLDNVNVSWAKLSSGTGQAFGTGIAVPATGNPVVTGSVSGTEMFDSHTLTGSPATCFLIAEYDVSNGDVVETRQGTSSNVADSSSGHAIVVDGSGIVYVTGRFNGVVNFGTSAKGSDAPDFFIAKYSPGLSEAWVKKGGVGLTGDATGQGIALFNGEPYVTGTFAGNMSLGAGGTKKINLGSIGNHDMFAARYDALGEIKWARRAGNLYTAPHRNNFDQGTGIALDGSGNVYVVGEFGGGSDFFNTTGLSFNHYRNVFAAKLSNNGVEITGTVTEGSKFTPDRVVRIMDIASSYSDYVKTGTDGIYTAYVPPTEGCIVNLVHDVTFWTWNPVAGYTVSGGSPSTGLDFNMLPAVPNVTDLAITITPQTTDYAVLGRPLCYLISYENIGTVDVPGPIPISLCFDHNLTSPSYTTNDPTLTALPAGVCGANTSLNWTLPSLPKLCRGDIRVCFTVPRDSSLIGTVLSANVTIGPSSDTYPANNSGSFEEEVVQPNDPNGKFSLPKGNVGIAQVRNGELVMVYTVEFYNLGPGVATRVDVTDVFEGPFDINGVADIEVLAAGPVWPTRTFDVPTSKATFTFTGANLAAFDKDRAGSRGFVTFAVPVLTTTAEIPIGRKIRNKACIVFHGDGGAQPEMCTNPVTNCAAPDFAATNLCIDQRPALFTSMDVVNNINYLTDVGPIRGWRWDFGDGGTAFTQNASHDYATPGTYVVTLTFKDDVSAPHRICDQLDTLFTVTKTIIVSESPQPTFTVEPGWILTSTPGVTYQWLRDGVEISGATSQTYHVLLPGTHTYRVRVTNGSDCEGTSNSLTLGVRNVHYDDPRISIRPNPGSGQFTLDPGHLATGEWSLAVVNINGEVVYQQVVAGGMTANSIDLTDQPSGVYTVRFAFGDEVMIRKLVLQR